MRTEEILTAIDAEIEKLNRARALLTGAEDKGGRGRPAKSAGPGKPPRTLTPEARAKIAAAQKARWAKAKKLK